MELEVRAMRIFLDAQGMMGNLKIEDSENERLMWWHFVTHLRIKALVRGEEFKFPNDLAFLVEEYSQFREILMGYASFAGD